MNRDDQNRVFDVSKPQSTGPTPTSRPIITGHHPIIGDPMVRGNDSELPQRPPADVEHRAIPIHTPDDPPSPAPSAPTTPSLAPVLPEHPESVASATPAGVDMAAPHSALPGDSVPVAAPAPTGELQLASLDDVIGDGPHHPHHLAHQAPPQVHNKKSRKGLWLLIILLILVVAAYLLIDSRLIKTSVNLPFHIFKQPAAVQSPPFTTKPPTTTTKPAASTVPTGFSVLTGQPFSFNYPTTWGDPQVNSEPGYSSRSTAAKSDGTYAYVVNFATNKDIQVVLTSSKYLPAARAATYYDFLQWCTGTNDGKFYKSILHFSTASKVDTPTTVTCDQGPLTDATKVNDFTILQSKTTNPDGSSLGDLYTLNLKETDLPVLRVKDATSKNADDIKKLLASVKLNSTTSTGSNASQ